MKRIFKISAALIVAFFLGLGVLFLASAGKRAKHSPKMIVMSSAHVVWASPTPSPANTNTMNANANMVVRVGNTNANTNLMNANVVVNSNTNTNYFDPVTGVWDAVTNWVSPKSKKPTKKISPTKSKKAIAIAKAKPKNVKKVSRPKPKTATAQIRKLPQSPPKPASSPKTPEPSSSDLAINALPDKWVWEKGERVVIKVAIAGGTPPYSLSGDNDLQRYQNNPTVWLSKRQTNIGPITYHIKVVDAKKVEAKADIPIMVVEPTGSPPGQGKTETKDPPPQQPPIEAGTVSLPGWLIFWGLVLLVAYKLLRAAIATKKPVKRQAMIASMLTLVIVAVLVFGLV